MSAQTVLQQLGAWIARGWLRPLDRAFASFLLDLDATIDARVLWAGALLSHQLERGEVYLDLEKLIRDPGLTLAIPNDDAWQHSAQNSAAELAMFQAQTLSDWLNALSQSSLITQGDGNTPLVLEGHRLYLRRYWRYQQIVTREIDRRLQPTRAALPKSLQASLKALFINNVQQPDWQKIACVLALRARFAIITGGPGTGKTTTLTKLLSVLIELAEVENQRKLTILLAAPTGKAAARVSESIAHALQQLPVPEAVKQQIPQKASTLHRLLGSRPDTRLYRHHRHNPLLADIVIVDEASMIDLEMMAALLDALPETAQLILLGDKDQLASVEAGSVMGDLCRGAADAAYDAATQQWIERHVGLLLEAPDREGSGINQQTVMLRHSHRFGAESGIGQLARAVNAGNATLADAILADTSSYPDLKRLTLTVADDAACKRLITASQATGGQWGYGDYVQILRDTRPQDAGAYDAWAARVLQAFDRFRVLCALRRGDWGVEGINQRIERWLFQGTAPSLWYEGRPVMVTRNDYNLGLMNGDIGLALQDVHGKLRVVFPGNEDQGGLRWLSPMRLPDVETAYAMTVHKSQGSEFEHVALILPPVRSPVITRELIYTGITRAKTRFTLLESRPDVLTQATLVTS